MGSYALSYPGVPALSTSFRRTAVEAVEVELREGVAERVDESPLTVGPVRWRRRSAVIMRCFAVRVVVLQWRLPVYRRRCLRLRRHKRAQEAAIQRGRMQRPGSSLLKDIRDIIDQRDNFGLVVEEGFEFGAE